MKRPVIPRGFGCAGSSSARPRPPRGRKSIREAFRDPRAMRGTDIPRPSRSGFGVNPANTPAVAALSRHGVTAEGPVPPRPRSVGRGPTDADRGGISRDPEPGLGGIVNPSRWKGGSPRVRTHRRRGVVSRYPPGSGGAASAASTSPASGTPTKNMKSGRSALSVSEWSTTAAPAPSAGTTTSGGRSPNDCGRTWVAGTRSEWPETARACGGRHPAEATRGGSASIAERTGDVIRRIKTVTPCRDGDYASKWRSVNA